MIERTIQQYLRDAIRNLEFKIFQADIFFASGVRKQFFFVSRLELGYQGSSASKGNLSVYDKMKSLGTILNATSSNGCVNAFEAIKTKEGFPDGID